MEDRMVGGAKWGFYYIEVASGATMVNWENPVVGIDMEGGTSIPAQLEPVTPQPKPIMAHVITTPRVALISFKYLKLNSSLGGFNIMSWGWQCNYMIKAHGLISKPCLIK